MHYQEGQEVIVVHDWDDVSSNRRGKVVKYRPQKDEIRIDNDWFHLAYVFPISAEQDIHKVQMERSRLKQVYNDSMKMVYELTNKRSRGEYK